MISNNKSNKSINTLISLNECTGLNLAGTESVKEVFGFGGTVLSNQGDPEVIIFVKFKNNVNISGILIEGSMDTSKNPSEVQLFVNKSTLDFSDIGSVSPAETINLTSNLGKNVNLKIAKFRSVSSLVVSEELFNHLIHVNQKI